MKKQSTKMSRAVSQLEHIYNSLNADFFSGELPVPIITVQAPMDTAPHLKYGNVRKRERMSLILLRKCSITRLKKRLIP